MKLRPSRRLYLRLQLFKKKTRSLPLTIAKIFALVGIIFMLISYGPSLWYTINGSERISNLLSETASAKALPVVKGSAYQPAFDSNLPTENSINMPSIGVKTVIGEAPNNEFESALRNGVWRVNDFGTPYNREAPTILTAHRFGYLAWSLDFRLHNSFYELPKLKVGDTLTIIWRQRKYTYAVYASDENTQITDYSADLILYTCRDLNSDVREIKYARLLEI